MRSCLVNPCKPFPSVRIAFVAVLTLLLSGWTTCTAIRGEHETGTQHLSPREKHWCHIKDVAPLGTGRTAAESGPTINWKNIFAAASFCATHSCSAQ
jgi:hypothetical protein